MNKHAYLVLGYCCRLDPARIDMEEVSVANVQDVLYSGLDAGSASIAVIAHTSDVKDRSVLLLVWCPERGLSLHSIDDLVLGMPAMQAFDYESDVQDLSRAMCALWVSSHGQFSIMLPNTFPIEARKVGN